MPLPHCPLCKSPSKSFYDKPLREYFQCLTCMGIFLHPSLFPDAKSEKKRYLEHNNDTEDKGYRNFVSPITKAVLQHFEKDHQGLDFGAGTAPVISKMLDERGYQIVQYDPYFHPYPQLLDKKYNYIVCCEVIEHFHFPEKSFLLLKNLLLPGGKLFCMTDIYNKTIDFNSWYYKNDQTHVFIFQEETLSFIRDSIAFSQMSINGRLITYTL